MKQVGLTVSGNRYEIKLEDAFADFINKDLQDAGVNLHRQQAGQTSKGLFAPCETGNFL